MTTSLTRACYTLLAGFGRLSLFRIGPQDIPRSSALLMLTALVNFFLSVIINQVQLTLGSAMLVGAVEIIALGLLTAVALYYVSHFDRAVQTFTALMGTGAIIGAVVLLLMAVLPALPWALRLGIFVWNLSVIAHILRHALGIHVIGAFIIAFGYAMLLIQLIVFVGRSLGQNFAAG